MCLYFCIGFGSHFLHYCHYLMWPWCSSFGIIFRTHCWLPSLLFIIRIIQHWGFSTLMIIICHWFLPLLCITLYIDISIPIWSGCQRVREIPKCWNILGSRRAKKYGGMVICSRTITYCSKWPTNCQVCLKLLQITVICRFNAF